MRRQLVATSLALVALVLLAFAIPLGIAVRNLLESRALDELQLSVDNLGTLLEQAARDCGELRLRVAQLGDPPVVFTVISGGGGVVATTRPDQPVVVGDEIVDAVQGRVGRAWADDRVAVASPWDTAACPQAAWLHASQPDERLRTEIARAWWAIAAVAAAVAMLAALTAWWSSRRLSRPLEALRDSAQRLGDGDFSARAPRSGLPEVDAIADALDGTASRLGRAVERANVFTEDASHQLRTPLTALRLQLESLEASGADPDAVDGAMVEADRLEATVADLVALTRVDAPEVEVDLGELVRRQLPSWRELAHDHGRELVDEVVPAPRVLVRPAAVAQAVHVLLDNALVHGQGRVTVEVGPTAGVDQAAAVAVCVSDEGPGPGRIGPANDGRGLKLARALVAAEGGRLTHAASGTGTRACVVLPVRR